MFFLVSCYNCLSYRLTSSAVFILGFHTFGLREGSQKLKITTVWSSVSLLFSFSVFQFLRFSVSLLFSFTMVKRQRTKDKGQWIQANTGYLTLLQFTSGYHRLVHVSADYYRLLKVTRVYYRLLQVTRVYYRLLQVTTGYYRLFQVTTGYYGLLQAYLSIRHVTTD